MIPPTAIGIAIVCGGFMLPIFALLGRVAPALRESGRRLRASFIVATVIWATLSLIGQLAGAPIRVIDIVAGAAILLAAAICAFLLISLLAWGFTISIARDLGAAARPLSLEEWKAAFAHGAGFDAFARDRIALLAAMGVATMSGDRLKLTGRGRAIARLAHIGMMYFGVERARGPSR